MVAPPFGTSIMNHRVTVTRTLSVPDSTRVARCLRAPELGPRVLFFSGGSALKSLSRALKEFTHNSVHLVTPFDSGGSSAHLRAAFDMLSIGDLRNRLVALADESNRGNPEIYRLFCHRLSKEAPPETLRSELNDMLAGTHRLVSAVPEPMRRIIRTHLRFFHEAMGDGFDLRGANIGNLLLTGGYLSQERDIRSTLFSFSKLLEVRGTVLPTADSTAHLAVRLDDGALIVGQHLITGKEVAPLSKPVKECFLVNRLHDGVPTSVEASGQALKNIQRADLICFPMGSFYSSVLANLLPEGVGRSVASAGCPKIYIPNMGHDPEQLGSSVERSIQALLDTLRKDCGTEQPTHRLMDAVLLDTENGRYQHPIDKSRIEAMGIQVIDTRLVDPTSGRPGVTPRLLSEILVTLAQ